MQQHFTYAYIVPKNKVLLITGNKTNLLAASIEKRSNFHYNSNNIPVHDDGDDDDAEDDNDNNDSADDIGARCLVKITHA